MTAATVIAENGIAALCRNQQKKKRADTRKKEPRIPKQYKEENEGTMWQLGAIVRGLWGKLEMQSIVVTGLRRSLGKVERLQRSDPTFCLASGICQGSTGLVHDFLRTTPGATSPTER